MYSSIYWIYSNVQKNKLGIMARPRGNDWLETEIQNLQRQNVNILLSLLEKYEIIELNLENEAFYCKKYNMNFINFPIKDRSTPSNKNEYIEFINYLYHLYESKNNIVIHCRMGIGRSSLVAISILDFYNFNVTDSINLISKIRTVKVPDTYEQVKWLLNYNNY